MSIQYKKTLVENSLSCINQLSDTLKGLEEEIEDDSSTNRRSKSPYYTMLKDIQERTKDLHNQSDLLTVNKLLTLHSERTKKPSTQAQPSKKKANRKEEEK